VCIDTCSCSVDSEAAAGVAKVTAAMAAVEEKVEKAVQGEVETVVAVTRHQLGRNSKHTRQHRTGMQTDCAAFHLKL